MKLHLKHLAIGLALTGGVAGNAMAIGTEADETVSNRATLTFDSGANTGVTLESAPGAGNTTTGVNGGTDTTFEVDRKLDIEVADANGADVTVDADEQDRFLTFTITNNGNDDQDVAITVLADPSSGDPYGTGDTTDMSNVQVCYDGGTDTVGTLTNVTCTAPAR